MDKQSLRTEALARRQAMAPEERARLDAAILEHLVRSDIATRAETIMTYVSYRGEVDTVAAIRHWLREGKRLCVPKVDRASRTLQAWAIEDVERDLAPGAYGILEPTSPRSRPVAPEDIDALIAPGLLFDRRGFRLGYGGGYYDRFLKTLGAQTETIALAYDWQIRTRLPVEPWDAALGWIATEGGISSSITER